MTTLRFLLHILRVSLQTTVLFFVTSDVCERCIVIVRHPLNSDQWPSSPSDVSSDQFGNAGTPSDPTPELLHGGC